MSAGVTVSANSANSFLNVAQSWLHNTKHSLRSSAPPEARTRSTRGAAYGNARRPTPWTILWKYATTRCRSTPADGPTAAASKRARHAVAGARPATSAAPIRGRISVASRGENPLAMLAHATIHRAHVPASPALEAVSSLCRRRAHAFSVNETCASSGNLTSSVPNKNPSASYAYSRSSFPATAMAFPVPLPTATVPPLVLP
mmetsp:Transcript_5423/g.22948  ORF Transcript_5423/g.22948 Transcript_5423/m.22948 type:complete len:202 (-) Transcript_5423:642-1247(-)